MRRQLPLPVTGVSNCAPAPGVSMMISSITEVVQPWDPAPFLDIELRRKMGVRHCSSAHECTDFFGWPEFWRLIDEFDESQDRITVNRHRIPHELFQTNGATDRTKIDGLIQRGASIVQPAAQGRSKRLAAIVNDFQTITARPMRVGVIASMGQSGALRMHSDPIDYLIWQMDGSKHWTVHDRDAAEMDDAGSAPAPVFDQELKQGELLFVPAGFPHICNTTSEKSLHLGFGFARQHYDPWGTEHA